MAEINHQVGIQAPPKKYELLTTDEGLSQWWTNDVLELEGLVRLLNFVLMAAGLSFPFLNLFQMKLWVGSTMPESWMGTDTLFQLKPDEDQTFVRFTHSNWKEPSDFIAHCSTK